LRGATATKQPRPSTSEIATADYGLAMTLEGSPQTSRTFGNAHPGIERVTVAEPGFPDTDEPREVPGIKSE